MSARPVAAGLLALWPSLASAGIFRHGKVEAIDVELYTGKARHGEIIPGEPAKLTVRLTDTRGNVKVTEGNRPRSLWRKLDVQVVGGVWDAERALVIPDPPGGRDVAALQAGTFEVHVRTPRTRGVKGIATRTLDWRAIHGPPPEEVSSVGIGGHGPDLLDNRWLLPGSKAQLVVEVKDTAGRAYRTEGSPVRMPWHRIEVTTDGLDHQGEGIVLAQRRRASTPYAATVVVPGTSVAPLTATWTRDWERIDGPEPANIARFSMHLKVPGGSPDGELPPGAITPVIAEATTKEGRVFTTEGGAVLSLPSERLLVRTRMGTWNPGPRTIQWSGDLRRMASDTYAVDLQYKGRPDLAYSLVMRPDLLAPLKPWTTPGAHKFHEEPGQSGRTGENGRKGTEGATSAGSRHGGHGTPAADGQAGAAGTPGPNLTVTAWTTTTLDKRHKVVVYVVDGPHGREVHVAPPGTSTIRIVSKGGDGGDGGQGGQGGRGGDGASACRSGDGGNGGDGGSGGAGGAAGRGGRISLRVDHSGTAKHFDLRSVPGTPGDGGRGGSGGRPGQPGQVVAPPTSDAQSTNACAGGSAGDHGSDGPPGPAGAQGARGRVRVLVDPSSVAAESAALPPKLREALP